MNSSLHKTRIAPTPSGYLHIGNIRSFLLARQLADEMGASVLLRIDDLDRDRVEDMYIQDILDTLSVLGINYEEGPADLQAFKDTWSQFHRLPLYNAALDKLAGKGHLFACVCSRADVRATPDGVYPGTCRHKNIPLDTPNVTWRLRTSETLPLLVNVLGEAPVSAMLPGEMTDLVVRKRNGFPAYQLSSLVDDVHFGVDLVVRGADLWNSTLAQLYIARLLGYESFLGAHFLHHPLIMDSDGEKMSKSAGATSIQYLRAHGATAADIRRLAGF